MPVLHSVVQRKVPMVLIFVKSTVFYARYFIVLHYHTVFYFFGFFGFFVPYASKILLDQLYSTVFHKKLYIIIKFSEFENKPVEKVPHEEDYKSSPLKIGDM